MRVKVLFFGMLKDIAGRAEDALETGADAQVRTVFEHYAERFPRLRELERSIVLARNREFTSGDTAIAEGDEIAFLPPVSGGTGPYSHVIENEAGLFALTRERIDVQKLAAQTLRGADGAVVTFEGVARNNTNGRETRCLDYECYEAMAIRVMAELGCEIARGHAVGRMAMVHRLGRLEIGETSVAIVVAAPHRRPAFEAAMEAIDRLKRIVPIWKKEHFVDGEVWVDGDWDKTVAGR